MRLAIFIIFSFLSCALSSKFKFEDNSEESFAKIQTPYREVTSDVSDKNEESPTFKKKLNISSDHNSLIQSIHETKTNTSIETTQKVLRYIQKLLNNEVVKDVLQPKDYDDIMYIPAKQINQTRDEIRPEFFNISSVSASSIIPKQTEAKENDKSKEMENKLVRKEIGSLNNMNIKDDISKPFTNVGNNMPQEIRYPGIQNNGAEANKNINIFPMVGKYIEKNSNSSIMTNTNTKTQNTLMESSDPKVATQSLESRINQENWKPRENDFMEADNFGLQAMRNLYYIQEPKLYSMGLYLERDEPARYVAAFNDQTEEARNLARFGYAVLQSTTMFIKKFPGAPLELPLFRNTQKSLLREQCPRRGSPQCPPASLRYRTSDGSCNNLQNLWWGSAMSRMNRFLPAVYHDGIQSIRRSRNGRVLPSARDITNLIHEDKDVPLVSVTHMLMQWGQFVDHDLTATGQSRGFNGTVPQCCLSRGIGFQPPEFMHPECLPIAVNLQDNFYGPLGVRCLEFLRSGPAPNEGCEFGPREQLSQVTSYLDASMVYSSNALHSDSLRIFRNGLLQYGKLQSRRPLLPKHESDLCKRGSLSTSCFRAGDGRLSEQPALTSLHIVFLRLHNRIATELSALNPHWSDEKLFQEARRIVGAVIQYITYREFLPIILGPQVMKIFDLEILKKGYYKDYDPTVNPTVANAFSTAAYRFGHSLVQGSFVRFDSNHRPLFNNVSIHDEFSNPANLETAGSVDRLLLGLVNQPCQRRDEFITKEMTNHLFQTPGFAFGMDLASLNIQRGRDHGLPPYVRWREPCGLSPIKTFDDLDRVMSPSVARKFKLLYSSVEDIDLFPAGLAEKSVVGGLVGPTFACIIGQQFSNLRRGDRFWYENPESENSFTVGQLQQIRQVTLAQILCKTIDGIETIQPFVFLATDILKNQRLSCNDPSIGHLNLELWAEQPSKFKNNADDLQKTKRTATDANNQKPKIENANVRRKLSNQEQAKPTLSKPMTTGINQNNKIVVKRPFGRPDNVTIVVQNNAVNSPVFVNEGIYGSHIRIQQQPIPKPISNHNHGMNNYPVHRPPTKPIPTTIPYSGNFQTNHPYIPYAFDDPSNPNPVAYGYKSPNFAQSDIFYDNFPSSPRPTLYTYYTNFQQQSTTRVPHHEVDGYLINYGSSHREYDSLPVRIYGRPKPSLIPGQIYELNNKQKPIYDDRKSPINQQPISTSSYQLHGIKQPSEDSYSQRETLKNENYFNNLNKSQHWYLNNYQKTPSDGPYNHDDLHSPHKVSTIKPSYSFNHKTWTTVNPYQTTSKNKPNNEYNLQAWKIDPIDSTKSFMQSQPYSISTTEIPSYQEKLEVNSSPAYSQGFPASRNDYERYSNATSTYQKASTSIENIWSDSLSYIKENSTRSNPQNDTFISHNSSFYHKSTNESIYEKDDQPQLSSYFKGSIDRPIIATEQYELDNFDSKTTNSFSLAESSSIQNGSIPNWSETSTVSFQVHKEEENHNSKPMKVHSVTIVTETIETVHQSGDSGYIPRQVTSEISRPLSQNTKSNIAVTGKPGQYYYEKNILRRYPDKPLNSSNKIEEIPDNNHYLTKESKETIREIIPVNPQENLNLSLTLEVFGNSSGEFTITKELPKPIKSSTHIT